MPRLRFRAKHSPSKIEDKFLFLWQLAKGPPLEREYRFHEQRRCRAGLLGRLTRDYCRTFARGHEMIPPHDSPPSIL